MDLESWCRSLPEAELLNLALRLCNKALPIWDEYCEENKPEYVDTVVGMFHKVDPGFLKRISLYIETYIEPHSPGSLDEGLKKLEDEFTDPIIALQDQDWDLPDAVRLTFYAFYNLVCGVKEKYSVFNELSNYVSVNQALDALMSAGKITQKEARELVYGKN
jgi:hypothetical protein